MLDLPCPFPKNSSPLKRFHPGCWLGCLLILSITIMHSRLVALAIITFFSGILIILNRLPIAALLRTLKNVLFLLLVVWGVQMLSQPDSAGLITATTTTWRFFLLFLLGTLFTAASPLAELQAFLEHSLSCIPFLPAKRISMLFVLTLRFLFLIQQKTRLIREAQQARCLSNKKNPLYKIVRFTTVLLRNLFLQADEMSAALEARCYSEETAPEQAQSESRDSNRPWHFRDFALLGAVLIMAGCLLFFGI